MFRFFSPIMKIEHYLYHFEHISQTMESYQMTKLKQSSNGFAILHSTEDNPWMEEHRASQAVEHSSLGILGKNNFMEYQKGRAETGHDWLGS